jgi:hypothetical protein
MSVALVQAFADHLPVRIREEVVGYSRSVENAAPDIFREAGIAFEDGLADQLVYAAGIKKLHAICSSSYWILDNSLNALSRQGITGIRLGPRIIGRGSREFQELSRLMLDLEQLLTDQHLGEVIAMNSYADILRVLRDGR